MSFDQQESSGSPVSQENFSQRSQQQSLWGLVHSWQQRVRWRGPWVWGLLVLVLPVGLSGGAFIGAGKAHASPFSQTPIPTQTTTRTFPVGDQPDLSITNTDAGSINVHTGSDDTIVITATIKSPTGNFPTVNFANPDNTHVIVTVTDNSPRSNRNSVDFDVTVPASSDLDLNARAGDITIVDGVQGTVNLQGGAGDISVSNTTLIGSGSIKVSTGAITFAGSIASGAAYQFQGNASNLDITLPSNTNSHVSARTTAGTIQSDFSEIHIHSTGITSQEGQGDIGSSHPSATLSLTTGTGSITIHKEAAA